MTSKEDLTADYLIIRLIEKKIPYFRVNTEDFPLKLEGAVRFPQCNFSVKDDFNRVINSKKISGIWYRRPKMLPSSKEVSHHFLPYIQEDSWFFINGLLELASSSTAWVSRPGNIRNAENKILQLKIAYKCGLHIPQTFIGNSPQELKKLQALLANKTLIAKPIRSGRYFFKNKTKLFYTSIFPRKWKADEIKIWPIIVQEKISKKRDIRVTIFKNKIFSVEVRISAKDEEKSLDWRRSIDTATYEPVTLPLEISKKLLQMLKIMGLSFGAFDLIETPRGEYVFLEVNPNGQWAWIEEKTGLPMRDALIHCLYTKN